MWEPSRKLHNPAATQTTHWRQFADAGTTETMIAVTPTPNDQDASAQPDFPVRPCKIQATAMVAHIAQSERSAIIAASRADTVGLEPNEWLHEPAEETFQF